MAPVSCSGTNHTWRLSRAFCGKLAAIQSLFNDLVADKDLFHSVSFTLPRSSSFENVVFLSVQIKRPTHEFRTKITLLVRNPESLVFVKTDKQIKVPGQYSIKLHIVSVDKNFHPLEELILAQVMDPGMKQIRQRQKIKLENGLKQLSFSLSSEPFRGSHKVVILKQSGRKTEHSFTVEETVLPKFDVQVKVPKVITKLDEEVNVYVELALPHVDYNEMIENLHIEPFAETIRNYFPETWIWDW
uniref:alpha-2-macroglobulin-like n=1 Tax=Halichoerus grypus TaxID=9711 RepID=UPI001659C02E|nr:alpha-2-macroglobulin-like [Halichoerus grypus]